MAHVSNTAADLLQIPFSVELTISVQLLLQGDTMFQENDTQ